MSIRRKARAMTISTILLIAVAALLVFIMFRVGWGSRDAAQAQAAVSHVDPEDQSHPDPRGSTNEVQADQGADRKRRGCC
jgi:hypothetical protein